jgi:hypothetical protein
LLATQYPDVSPHGASPHTLRLGTLSWTRFYSHAVLPFPASDLSSTSITNIHFKKNRLYPTKSYVCFWDLSIPERAWDGCPSPTTVLPNTRPSQSLWAQSSSVACLPRSLPIICAVKVSYRWCAKVRGLHGIYTVFPCPLAHLYGVRALHVHTHGTIRRTHTLFKALLELMETSSIHNTSSPCVATTSTDSIPRPQDTRSRHGEQILLDPLRQGFAHFRTFAATQTPSTRVRLMFFTGYVIIVRVMARTTPKQEPLPRACCHYRACETSTTPILKYEGEKNPLSRCTHHTSQTHVNKCPQLTSPHPSGLQLRRLPPLPSCCRLPARLRESLPQSARRAPISCARGLPVCKDTQHCHNFSENLIGR